MNFKDNEMQKLFFKSLATDFIEYKYSTNVYLTDVRNKINEKIDNIIAKINNLTDLDAFNLTEEYNCIHSSSSTSFFRSSIISGKKFEENIISGEDTRFVNLILLTNPTMGLIREAIYFCRKRNDFSSRTQTQKKDVKFYFLTIQEVS